MPYKSLVFAPIILKELKDPTSELVYCWYVSVYPADEVFAKREGGEFAS